MSADLNELDRLLREATAGPWYVDAVFTVVDSSDDNICHVVDARDTALIAALRNSAEEWILDARACAEIRRVIALGKDDGSVGRAARRAIAQEQK